MRFSGNNENLPHEYFRSLRTLLRKEFFVPNTYDATDSMSGREVLLPTPPVPYAKRPAVIYPTVSPETIVIPIISCILCFPLLALLVICCLRRRAKLARERARRRPGNNGADQGSVSLVRLSPIHKTDRSSRAVSLRSERAMSRGFPSMDLDTVLEERSDPEITEIGDS